MAAAMGFLNNPMHAHPWECSTELHGCPSILHYHSLTSATPTQRCKLRLKNGVKTRFLCLKHGKSLKPRDVKSITLRIILVRGWPGWQKVNL